LLTIPTLDTLLQQFAETSWPEWLGMSTGIVGVWLSIKQKVAAWPLFILCYSCYAYIGYISTWFAFVGMNVVFVGISLYGWRQWSRPPAARREPVTISKTSVAHWPRVGLCLVLGTWGVGTIVGRIDGAQLPYLDAFATCCGFTAQWMLSRKHMETWIFWIISNSIYLSLFIAGSSWPSVLLFATFIVLAVKGWREWSRIYTSHRHE
jgi:nicotinamide mononucleotide transporter